MKRALDMNGRPHKTIDAIEQGVAGGWLLVFFADGTERRMTCSEAASLGVNPFVNVNKLVWRV